MRAKALPMYVETISEEAGFAELAGSWDELVRAMPRPSPFLLHSWLLEWWRHYGRGADLAVHVAYRTRAGPRASARGRGSLSR